MADGIKIENTEISIPKALAVMIFVVFSIIGIFDTVILPLNAIQVTLVNIQSTLADDKTQIAAFNSAQNAQNAQISLLQAEVSAINNKLGIK